LPFSLSGKKTVSLSYLHFAEVFTCLAQQSMIKCLFLGQNGISSCNFNGNLAHHQLLLFVFSGKN